jgi:hypothetical protein
MDRNELPFEPRHLGVPSGASKKISEPMVRMAQTIHLSCTETNTISKRIEMRFYMTHVTLEHCPVRPKRFLRLWDNLRKLCTYLVLNLTLSPNGPKRVSIWASSRRSTIRCIQNNFCAYGTYGANHAPKLTLSPKGSKGDSTWPTSPRSSIGCVQNYFWGYGTFGANCGSILHRDKHYLQMDQNEILHDPCHLRVPLGASKWFLSLRYV